MDINDDDEKKVLVDRWMGGVMNDDFGRKFWGGGFNVEIICI
jgi:hypothetical protein